MTCLSAALAISAVSLSPSPVYAGTRSPATPGVSQGTAGLDDEETFTFTAEPAEAGILSGAAARITCKGSFKGSRAYDAPHPAASSKKRKINAHLSVTCTGPGAGATLVTVSSRMTDGHRAGKASSKRGFGKARTGGDLACVKSKRAYRAVGLVVIKFPPRYSPPSATGRPSSVAKAFKRNGKGICVKP
ncbi:hypothetical protein J4573_02850 [Actinomadura barringtoniae]|uniref:Uncharacterized protein n=1 Tax=Actinomadura barringtoniae TaxID=1427535 RepID=A0A939P6S6_9ACTN|nr:hypothetical protein [Actinomadura barringtoniae]MBO2446012.1 hypothetical protein [Actinomadura barringtoniae]